MIWFIFKAKNLSIQVVSVNVTHKETNSELWVERVNGDYYKAVSGTPEEINLHKEAVDFALAQGHKTYEVK